MTVFSARQLLALESGDRLPPQFPRQYFQAISQNSALFGGLDERELACVLDQCHLLTARAGETIYRAGDLPGAIYLLLDGGVDLRLDTPAASLVKESLQRGASFGDAALIGIMPHTDTALCTTASEVLVLPTAGLARLQAQWPGLFSHLLLNLARDFSRRLLQHDMDFQQLAEPQTA